MATTSITFSALLKRFRLTAGLTQEGLAERSGLSARGVQNLERGGRIVPRPETVRLLADALGLDQEARGELLAAAYPDAAVLPASPPIRLAARQIPLPATPLVGREREVAAICAALRSGEDPVAARLLTLTGPGGVGKTRLALAAANELADAFPDGVAWVELAPLRDHELVTATIAHALGVGEAGDRPLAEQVLAFVAARRILLVLDNFEHLLAAAPLVARLLATAPGLVVLATSRTRLRLRGEQEIPVAPLALPDSAATPPLAGLAGVPAVRLFVERAADVSPEFTLSADNAAAVTAVCRRLDGLPLAIELAAARVKLLAPAALLARLEHRLPLLTGGARDLPLRQQTMRDAIAWSHDLLSPDEQLLFRRLAVFAGGFTLATAEGVAAAERPQGAPPPPERSGAPSVLELVTSLLDQNLVRWNDHPPSGEAAEPRFTMLETVREFALASLEASGEAEAVRRAHAALLLRLAEDAHTHIHGPQGSAMLDQFEAEHDNLRAALAWAIERGETEMALRLTYACWRFWWMRSQLDQGRLWLERALALPDPAAAIAPLRTRTLVAAAYFARIQGDYGRAAELGEEALALAQHHGDNDGGSRARHALGLIATDRGDFARARAHLEAALAIDRALGYSHGVAFQLSNLGDVALAQGRFADAAAYGEEALAIWRGRGDRWSEAYALIQLGKAARVTGDYARASAVLHESLTAAAALGDMEIAARAVAQLATIASTRGQFRLAAHLFGNVAALREQIGAPLAPAERADYERAVAATRQALAADAFATAWETGRALPPATILRDALLSAQELA